MKQLFTLILFSTLVSSCTRERPHQEDTYLQQATASLKKRLQEDDFTSLDFKRAVLTKVDSAGLYLLRVPFKDKALRNDFVLVKTDKAGQVEKGKIIHLEGRSFKYGDGKANKSRFDGNISISSLDRKTVLTSRITNGYIEALHAKKDTKTMSLMPEGEVLPEVVVVGYITYSGISYSDWVYLSGFFYDTWGGGSGWGGYYTSLDGTYYGGGGYSGGSGDSDGDIVLDPPILIDYETDISKSSIDLVSYFKCFDNIPDAGSSCSIELYVDIPVDSDPYKLFNWDTESPGHSFIQLKKSNGAQSTIQNIGFYPNTQWKNLVTTAPTEGKIVDNGNHEFNASIKMNVSPENFKSILTEVQYLSRFIQYDIDEYNCTDFALDVFNKIRTSKLTVPMYDIPGGTAVGGSRTPQGLFNQLKSWKDSGHPESANITIPGYKGWVAESTGPCN